jgi:DNA-binding XRE family transcriptional regulator
MSINDRVKKIRESLNLEKSAMARLLNMTPQTYGTIENEDNGLSMANFQKFAVTIPHLNLRWFLLEEGKMFYEVSEIATGVNEEAPPYLRLEKELSVTVYVEKECPATGGACAFSLVPELKKEVEMLKKENEVLKNKKK